MPRKIRNADAMTVDQCAAYRILIDAVVGSALAPAQNASRGNDPKLEPSFKPCLAQNSPL